MTKKMSGVSLKSDEETLYTNKSRDNFKRNDVSGSKVDGDKMKGKNGSRQREDSTNPTIVESSMASVTIVGRWATWRKIVGPRKSILRVMLLLQVQRRITKMIGMTYRY